MTSDDIKLIKLLVERSQYIELLQKEKLIERIEILEKNILTNQIDNLMERMSNLENILKINPLKD